MSNLLLYNPSKSIIPGKSLNVLTLLFNFCSSASDLLLLVTEVCQPRISFSWLKAHPKKGLRFHCDPEDPVYFLVGFKNFPLF